MIIPITWQTILQQRRSLRYRDECMETRLNHPDRLAKHSVAVTILTYVRDDYVETRLNRPDRLTKHCGSDDPYVRQRRLCGNQA